MRPGPSVAALALALAGCSLVLGVDPERTLERTEALCSDGIDNDADGLADCHDWKCLGLEVCCTVPSILLEDRFDADARCVSASCDAPPPECAVAETDRWIPWGAPLPVLCDGTLAPQKREQCYDVGVLSRATLPLRPGLGVEVEVVGRPEVAGRLEVVLTHQAEVIGGITRCDAIAGVEPLVAVRQARSVGGYQLVARTRDREMGRSPEVPDDGAHHLVGIAVQADHRVHFLLDRVEFAATPDDEPLPAGGLPVHLVVQGRSLAARFDGVRVIDGNRCQDPAAWRKKPDGFVAVAPWVEGEKRWASFQVSHPAITRGASSDQALLYYTACVEGPTRGACDRTVSLGRAVSSRGGPFQREPSPLGSAWAIGEADVGVLRVEPWRSGSILYYTHTETQPIRRPLLLFIREENGRVEIGDDLFTPPDPDPSAWDAGGRCCASAVERDGRVLLWYAGRSRDEAVWRVGHASSSDGVHFQAHPANPVLVEGPADGFDGRGMTEPEVVYDPVLGLYRMWYTARAAFDVTSLGHAVSPDGVTWYKAPGNPVLRPADVGLETFGSPAVLLEVDRIRLWVHGREAGQVPLQIYELENLGRARNP